MEPGIACVRRFHRAVAERIGVLHDRYLGRARPYGQARLLWEIGRGVDLRMLRARLDLDSGYLSRLVQALRAAGLVRIERSRRDRRVHRVTLTRAGAAERRALDSRSDQVARRVLAPLGVRQRERLLQAMAEVERLLAASMVVVAPAPADSPEVVACVQAYFAELAARFAGGFDASRAGPTTADVVLVARLRGAAIACGAVVRHADHAEIKRLWVAESARGTGVGRRMLAELEAWARRAGCRRVRLDTNRALTEAVAMYRTHGYRRIARYNDNPYAHVFFEKVLSHRGRSRGVPVTGHLPGRPASG